MSDNEHNNTTPTADTTPPADQGGKTQGGSDTVPYGRFKEVNDENKTLKAKLAEFEQAQAKAEADKKKQEEAEALKKGEHEKIIAKKQAQLENYKTKEEEWKSRTESIQAMVDVKYKEIETAHGAEILAKVKNLIGSDDPRVVLHKLDDMIALVGANAPRPQGGQQHQAWGGKTTLDALKDKISKGERLSPAEEKLYFEELAKLQ